MHIVQTSNKEQNLSWTDHLEKSLNSAKNGGVSDDLLGTELFVSTNSAKLHTVSTLADRNWTSG